MARSKGSKNRAEKPAQAAQEAMHGTETPEQVAEVKEPEKEPEKANFVQVEPIAKVEQVMSFSFDTWIYHETETPRILKAGNPMPEGWQNHRKFELVAWTFDSCGNWTRTEK